MEQEHPISCNRDCGAGCPLKARIKRGRIVRITDNPLRGEGISGCVRGYRMMDTLYSPERIRTPLKRAGARGKGDFVPVSWEEALDTIAEKLTSVKQQEGPDKILALAGSGSCRGAVHNTSLLGERFFRIFGGSLPKGTYSCQALRFTQPYIYGTNYTGFDAKTLEKSQFILLWGADIKTTRFGANLEYYIRKARKRGVPIIVVDPVKTDTASALGTRWISIIPGTDSVLMAAILHELITRSLIDRDFLSKYTVGFQDIESYILGTKDGTPKSPAWASPICGIEALEIIHLAQEYGSLKPAALIPGYSIQRVLGGEDVMRFAAILQAATGNTGVPGGTAGGKVWEGLPCPPFPTFPPVDGETPNGSLPVYLWAGEAVKKGIKVIYNIGTNMLVQGSDISLNIKAFQSAEFTVSHELFLTPTALYSDLVLPATTFLEREDVVFPSENYLYYSSKVTSPLYEAENDFTILDRLASRLGFRDAFSNGRSAEEWLEYFLKESVIPDVGSFKETGIYDGGEQERTAFSDFIQFPEKRSLKTPSGRIELSSPRYSQNGFFPVPQCGAPALPTGYPIRLLTPHAKYKVNSQNTNLSWINKYHKDHVKISVSDAQALGLKEGNLVRISSPEGNMQTRVVLSKEIANGTAVFFQGGWEIPGEENAGYGTAVNILTSTVPTLPSFGSRTHTVFVRIEKAN